MASGVATDERDERGHGRPVDERQRAEDVLDRIPGRPVTEAEAEWSNAGPASAKIFQTIAPSEDEARERRTRVSGRESARSPSRPRSLWRRACKGLDDGTALTARERTRFAEPVLEPPFTRLSPDRHHRLFPCDEGARARSSRRESKRREEENLSSEDTGLS